VEGKRAEDSSNQGETSSAVKKGSTPPGEVSITRSNKRKAVIDRQFVGGKEEDQGKLGGMTRL
jgi:hypothetical protein